MGTNYTGPVLRHSRHAGCPKSLNKNKRRLYFFAAFFKTSQSPKLGQYSIS